MMDNTIKVCYNIPQCPGVTPHPECNSFEPIDSLRYFRLCLDDFGEIHCKYACAFCESNPIATEEEKKLYNRAFIDLHDAFGYLSDGIRNHIIGKSGMNCPVCAIAGGLSLFPIIAKYSRPRPISHERIPADQVPNTIDSFPCNRTTIEACEDMPEQTESLKDIEALEMMNFRKIPALPPPIIQQTTSGLIPGFRVLNAFVRFEVAFEDDQKWKYEIEDAERSLQHSIELKAICPEYGTSIQNAIDYHSQEVADLKSGVIRERRKPSRTSLIDDMKCNRSENHLNDTKEIKSGVWSTVMSKQQASSKMQVARTTLDGLIDKYPNDVIVLSPQRYRFNCLNPEFGIFSPDDTYNSTQKKCSQL